MTAAGLPLPSTDAGGSPKPARVLFLSSSFHFGGAERQLVELIRGLDRTRFEPVLCSLDGFTTLAADLGIAFLPLLKRTRYDVTLIPRAFGLMRRERIDLVHCLLFDAEMVGRLAGRLAGIPVISSERNSDYAPRPVHDRLLRLTSGCFTAMIANSQAGKEYNVRRLGVAPERIHVIPNGVRTDRFRPHDVAAVWERVGIPRDRGPLVGIFAAFKGPKNHEMFVEVADRVRREIETAQFLLVAYRPSGDPVAETRERAIMAEVVARGLGGCTHLLLDRADVEDLYCLCDLTVLTSTREGTPNVVLESMASGVGVVATDVADNRAIIGESGAGQVVASRDAAGMAERVIALLRDPEGLRRMGAAARRRVVEDFSVESLVRRTQAVYAAALRPSPRGPR